MTAHHMSAHHMTSHCITWHDTTQAITSHQITWAHITSHRIASRDMTQHKQSHRIKWHDHHIKWHDMHQNRSHHHHGTAKGSFTAKKWFGHRAGRSPCAHSIGKFFLCYIVLFSSETSAPGSPGNYLYPICNLRLLWIVSLSLSLDWPIGLNLFGHVSHGWSLSYIQEAEHHLHRTRKQRHVASQPHLPRYNARKTASQETLWPEPVGSTWFVAVWLP